MGFEGIAAVAFLLFISFLVTVFFGLDLNKVVIIKGILQA